MAPEPAVDGEAAAGEDAAESVVDVEVVAPIGEEVAGVDAEPQATSTQAVVMARLLTSMR